MAGEVKANETWGITKETAESQKGVGSHHSAELMPFWHSTDYIGSGNGGSDVNERSSEEGGGGGGVELLRVSGNVHLINRLCL